MVATTQRELTSAQSDSPVLDSASGKAVAHFPESACEAGIGGRRENWWEQAFPGTADQLQHLRAATSEFLADCPVADDVVLITHELAANAVRHSRSGLESGTFTVRLLHAPGQYVLAEVVDGGSDWDGDLQRSARDASGLYLVIALSAACGVSGGPHRRAVWFQMPYNGATATNQNKGKGNG